MAGDQGSGGSNPRTDGTDGLPGESGEGRPAALLFDWDNTLADTWPAIHHALAVMFRAMDREPWTFEQTRARVRASARDSFPALFGSRAEEAMGIFYRSFESDHLAKLRERPGATDMLERLGAAGFGISISQGRTPERPSPVVSL